MNAASSFAQSPVHWPGLFAGMRIEMISSREVTPLGAQGESRSRGSESAFACLAMTDLTLIAIERGALALKTSPIWQPTLKTGLSADSASWKIIAIFSLRTRRRFSRTSEQVLAPEEDPAPGDPAGRGVEDAHDGLRGDRLARAGLAEHREVSPASLEVDAVDGLGHAVAGLELHVQAFDPSRSGSAIA